MFSGDDWHVVKEALIFVATWKVIETGIEYIGDMIPAIRRKRNSEAAQRLNKARKDIARKETRQGILVDSAPACEIPTPSGDLNDPQN